MKKRLDARQITATCFLMIISACDRTGAQNGGDPSEAISHDLGPFFRAETAMYDSMRAAIGTSSGDNWVRMMIAHHEGGAALSRMLLQENPSPQIRTLAMHTVRAQERAVRELEKLLRDGPTDLESALVYLRPIQKMHDATTGVFGPGLSRVWLRKMIEHHRGAIEMSNVLLKRPGVPTDTANAVRKLRNEQVKEMKVLKRAREALEA
jgi:uncharacterized protein (DUF305 family)